MRCALLLVALVSPVSAQEPCETPLLPADPGPVQRFGYSIDIDGDRCVVGSVSVAPAGAVYVFERAGGTWIQTAKVEPGLLTPSWFGVEVGLDGDRLAVGSFFIDSAGETRGTVFLYREVQGAWFLEQRLVPFDGEPNDYFGKTLALDGDRLVVGSAAHDGGGLDAGAAYVYDRDPVLGWSLTQRLVGSTTAPRDWFGTSVALEGDRLVVGATRHRVPSVVSGAVYVFERVGAQWLETAEIVSPIAGALDDFGIAVALSGERLAVGANGEDASAIRDGAVHVFARVAGVWQPEAHLVRAHGANNDGMGSSVALEGDTLVVGTRDADPGPAGAAFQSWGSASVYRRTGSAWALVDELFASAAAQNDGIGWDVALDGRSVAASGFSAAGLTGRALVWTLAESLGNTYCAAVPNSTGAGAELALAGSPRVLENCLHVSAAPVPANEPGYLMLSMNQSIVPMPGGSAGTLCIGLPIHRPVGGVFTAGADQTLRVALDLFALPGSLTITAGQTWNFQVWFRDGATTNFSSAAALTFE